MRSRVGGSRADDDLTDDIARLGPNHPDRVRGSRIREADPEVVVDGEISIGSVGRWARSWRAGCAPFEELEHGMRRGSELTRLDRGGLDEHAPVPEQRCSVAR